MTATLTETGSYATVSQAWDLYQHAQEVPVPRTGAGRYFAARSRLFRAVEPYACWSRPVPGDALAEIQKAAGALAAIVGGERSVAA